MKITRDAPSLQTKITGDLDQKAGLVCFRGLPYAEVRARWTHSIIKNNLNGDLFDATHFGPRCPQRSGAVLVSGGVADPSPGDDEFRCLNLNITTPVEAVPTPEDPQNRLLPVMVWIHGGAFAFGSNSVARYRPHAFAGQAKSLGKPVILVQINYRLGALGFAASKHITLDTGDPRIGNYGFVDQRNALLWVNAHVQNFGGDPSNITVFGVSAGSASIHHHLLSGAPLFDRAIMMSGVAPTLGPYPLHALEKSWEKPCDRYGLTQSTSAERLRFLRGLDPLELLEAYSTGVVGPAADGKLLPSNCGIADPIPSSRCKAIILGDTNAESMIYKPLIQHLSQSHFHQRVHAEFSQYDAQEFYTHFGFTTRPEPEETFEGKILSLLGTVIFHFPNMQIAAHGNLSNPDMDMFLYHFEEPSPFPGPTHGYSYHGLCALLLHLNSFKECPKPTQDVSLELHRIWTFFAYGEQPWESYSNSHRFMRFGPDGGLNMLNQNKDTTRTYGYLPWLAQHFDQIYPFLRSILTELRENSLPLR